MPVAITNENLEQEITKSPQPVIMDVFATWCGPCQYMAPIFEELAKELSDKYKFATLNVDEAREVSIQYGVTSVPTFVFIKDGNVVAKETGQMSKDDLKEKITQHLG